MKIKKTKKIKEVLVKKLYGALWKLENTGDSDYVRSGEKSFITSIGEDYFNESFVLFDIGANKGEYTEMILNALPNTQLSAHLFEPQKTCQDTLQKKFSDNPNVTINPVGLSNEALSGTLYKDEEQSGFASVYKRNLDHYDIELNIAESISLVRGDEYVAKNNVAHIHLMKVDVEGHELSVFDGFGEFLNPDNIDYIQFEYGGANLDSHTSLLELHNYLSKKGFVLCKMMRNHLTMRVYEPTLENFMYQNWVAVSPRMLNTSI